VDHVVALVEICDGGEDLAEERVYLRLGESHPLVCELKEV
jgi:hypothetical protein